MLKSTELNMDAIRASLKLENEELLKRGFELPYLEDGKISSDKLKPSAQSTKFKEPA
jgi:hypothetical protein